MTGTMTRRTSNMAPKPTGREPCQRPKITILAFSEADQLLVGRAATMRSKKPAVKTILDCLRGRDQSSNGTIAPPALLFGTGESAFLRMLAAAAAWKLALSLERHCPKRPTSRG